MIKGPEKGVGHNSCGEEGVRKSITDRWHLSVSGRSGGTPLVTEMVKNLPAVKETGVPSLGWEDPLEKGMATHSSVLAWRSP